MDKLLKILDELMCNFFNAVLIRLHVDDVETKRNNLIEFVKFGIVGLSNTAVSYIIYVLVLQIFSLINLRFRYDYFVGNVVSFVLSVLWSFYWNNKYVFKVKDGEKRNIFSALLKTYMTYAFTGLILNNILAYVWIDIFHIHKMIAPLITLIVSVPINFILNKLWAFRTKKITKDKRGADKNLRTKKIR